jgi:hypothetical protein
MMGQRTGMVLLVAFGALAGCALDEGGLLVAGGPDAGPLPDVTQPDATPPDGSPPDAPQVDAPPDAPPVEAGVCDDDGGACQSPDVPLGWTPVAYAESLQTSCPSGWAAPDDNVTGVANGTAACTCDCTIAADPSCTTGTTQTYASNSYGCGTQGVSLTFNNGGCVTLYGNMENYYASTAIAPYGGQCSITATGSGALQTTPARLCAPSTQCQSAVCGGYAPTGFTSCIVADGDQSCPSGSSFTVKHTVAASAAPSCAATCGTSCTFTGTCDNPQVTAYSNSSCTTVIATLASDDTCVATNAGGQTARGATYSATANFSSCTASGSTSVQIDLTGQRTVCCRP